MSTNLQLEPSKIFARLGELSSVEIITKRHKRLQRRRTWIVAALITGLIISVLLLLPSGYESRTFEPAMKWLGYYLKNPPALFRPDATDERLGAFLVGLVYILQLTLCLITSIFLFKIARARIGLPKTLKQAQQQRANMDNKTLRALFDEVVHDSIETEAHSIGAPPKAHHYTLGRGVIVSTILLLAPALWANASGYSVFGLHYWRQALNDGLFEFGGSNFVFSVGVLGLMLHLPLYVADKGWRLYKRRNLKLVHNNMLVLQQDIFGKQLEGSLSRVEATQGGELSIDQAGELSIKE